MFSIFSFRVFPLFFGIPFWPPSWALGPYVFRLTKIPHSLLLTSTVLNKDWYGWQSLCNIRHISIHFDLCHRLLDYKKSTYRYLSFRFYYKLSLVIPFCHRVWSNTYETRISIIEPLDFYNKLTPRVSWFLDFKINIVLYFIISPIYRIGRFRCIWILWKLEESNHCRLLKVIIFWLE